MEASICFKAYFILREEKRLTKSVWAFLEPFALMCSVARMTLKHTYCGSKKRKLFKSLLFSGFDDVHFILLFVEHFSQIEYRKLVIKKRSILKTRTDKSFVLVKRCQYL